jgi:hypothetical protein
MGESICFSDAACLAATAVATGLILQPFMLSSTAQHQGLGLSAWGRAAVVLGALHHGKVCAFVVLCGSVQANVANRQY